MIFSLKYNKVKTLQGKDSVWQVCNVETRVYEASSG